MRLDDVTLTGATIADLTRSRKYVEHAYDWSDTNYVTEMGQGITRFRITCTVTTQAALDALAEYCDRTGDKNLYYPSAQGVDPEDRYYIVKTSGLRATPVTAALWNCEFDCLAADPTPYDVATSAHVWG